MDVKVRRGLDLFSRDRDPKLVGSHVYAGQWHEGEMAIEHALLDCSELRLIGLEMKWTSCNFRMRFPSQSTSTFPVRSDAVQVAGSSGVVMRSSLSHGLVPRGGISRDSRSDVHRRFDGWRREGSTRRRE